MQTSSKIHFTITEKSPQKETLGSMWQTDRLASSKQIPSFPSKLGEL